MNRRLLSKSFYLHSFPDGQHNRKYTFDNIKVKICTSSEPRSGYKVFSIATYTMLQFIEVRTSFIKSPSPKLKGVRLNVHNMPSVVNNPHFTPDRLNVSSSMESVQLHHVPLEAKT